MQAEESKWEVFVDRMSNIDWTRANDEWSARVITADRKKVNTGYAASKAAADDIKRMIGWTPPLTAMEVRAREAQQELLA